MLQNLMVREAGFYEFIFVFSVNSNTSRTFSKKERVKNTPINNSRSSRKNCVSTANFCMHVHSYVYKQ